MKRRASLAGRSGYDCQGKCATLVANKSSAHSEVEKCSRLFASPLAYDTSVLPAWGTTVFLFCVARLSRERDRAIATGYGG